MAMGLTGKENPYKKGFGPFPDFISHSEFPYNYRDISDDEAINMFQEHLEKIGSSNIAAILIEIQLGEGGYIPASEYFLKKIKILHIKITFFLFLMKCKLDLGEQEKCLVQTQLMYPLILQH